MPQRKPDLMHAGYFVVILDVGIGVKNRLKTLKVVATLFSRCSRAFVTNASGWFQFPD